MFEGLAVEELHRDERVALMLVDLVDRADVGMIQGRRGLGLALEAAECLGIFGDVVGKEFQRDEPLELGVLGLVDDTHPAAAQLLENSVVGYGLADHACRTPSTAQLS